MNPHDAAAEARWRQAIASGELGLWDLRLDLETVQYSPQWKQRLGFPDPRLADSTHFWRCRVHPDDLAGMLAAMRAHIDGHHPAYASAFRLRSNGSGYRRVHSRGRVVDRHASGRATRIVGTMIDLTDRPISPAAGLPEGPRGAMAGVPLELPFHEVLAPEGPPDFHARVAPERQRLLHLVQDLLHDSLVHLHAGRSGE